MRAPGVVIVNYGLGNLFSVERAIEHIGARAEVSDDPSVIERADRLILPGVGAFGDGMANLKKQGLHEALIRRVRSGTPLLGVCLGMQLLMTTSEEFGLHRGLNLIEGEVVRFQPPREDDRFKVPHIGWNSVHLPEAGPRDLWRGTPLGDAGEGAFMYFLHSYFVVPRDPKTCLATTRYGRDVYCSVVRRENVTGVQFHPERSSEAGLEIYHRFVFDQ